MNRRNKHPGSKVLSTCLKGLLFSASDVTSSVVRAPGQIYDAAYSNGQGITEIQKGC